MNDYVIGIDVGTHSMKMVVSNSQKIHAIPEIQYTVESPSHGFRHGYIVDQDKAGQSFKRLLEKAEKKTKQKISKARCAIGGVGLSSQYVRTSLKLFKKSGEISERNVQEVIQKAEDLFVSKYPNKKILHTIPVKYRVDNRDVLGTPISMYGNTIEVKVIFITILEHHYDAYISMFEHSRVNITDIMAGPLADAALSLNDKQKNQGSILVNIGSETTSIATFENGIITSLDVFSIGSNDITNDIALGLQISLDEADRVKCGEKNDHPKKRLEEIIHARIADVLECIDTHLHKIKKNRLLPAGIVFTGAGSEIEHLAAYAKSELKLPATILAIHQNNKKSKRTTIPNQFSVAYGLCVNETRHHNFSQNPLSFKKLKQSLNYWIGQIMP